jgi:hypothetical protein
LKLAMSLPSPVDRLDHRGRPESEGVLVEA